ncbi:GGDEF domain-containing protein [Frateuria terrea]|uniref:diguanylate cyclase n=1 Tax=Frateuria terrea TaxID=529704 RepID=A0A1H6QM31_9GAMM|nr:GGDEF domain-containing protein [Frateuria terrea]SEI44821.1 diguanylate cyclase (GGDEF) domain-containing protein [Frateuria terrea]SFP10512.1 diguanylate cyclase (GGDEF) domain-containing protein [Frateuria terrea]
MQAPDIDDRYVRMAVLFMLSLALLGATCATAIHWAAPVHRPMDLIVPPAISALYIGLIVALTRRPQWVVGIARIALVAGVLALAAPSWLYTLQATSTPGTQLIDILPPVSSLFVVLLVMLMIFVPGRLAFLLAALAWVMIALPVLAHLLLHREEMWSARGMDLLMAYGPASIMAVVLLPVQRGLAGKIRRLATERQRMEALLHRDPLTGVQSRLLGERRLREALDADAPAGVIMLDLDRFKAINDTYGHPVGDRVLQAVASGCEGLLRGEECISRWGGEEFLALVPEVDASGLLQVAERLRAAIAGSPVAPVQAVTASFGATMIQRGDTLDTVLQRADLALYRAKEQGGNRVEAAAS